MRLIHEALLKLEAISIRDAYLMKMYLEGLSYKEMAEQEVTDVSLIVGGTIPKRDFQKLKEMGVGLIFPTQTSLDTVIAAIQDYRASSWIAAFTISSGVRWIPK